MVESLAFLSTVWVGTILNLTLLVASKETVLWLLPVSGMQMNNNLTEGAWTGPSQSGISGVGLLKLFLFTTATLVHAWPGAPRAGNEAADCCDCASIGSWYEDASEGGYSTVYGVKLVDSDGGVACWDCAEQAFWHFEQAMEIYPVLLHALYLTDALILHSGMRWSGLPHLKHLLMIFFAPFLITMQQWKLAQANQICGI